MDASNRLSRLDYRYSLALLNSARVPVGSLIDVGAAEGVFLLSQHSMNLFPGAPFLLIDCLDENKPVYEKLGKLFGAGHAIAAVGEADGETVIDVDPGMADTRIAAGDSAVGGRERRTVPLRRLDTLLPELAAPAPYLLKIDVQGGEAAALRGAEGLLPQCSIIVVEARTGRDEGGLLEIWRFLSERGFTLFDLCNIGHHKQTQILYQLDAIFLRADLDFRDAVAQQATPEAVGRAAEIAGRREKILEEIDRLYASIPPDSASD